MLVRLAIAATLVGTLGGCANDYGLSKSLTKAAPPLPIVSAHSATEDEIRQLTEHLQRSDFKDPDSIKIRNLRVEDTDKAGKRFCGEYTAKNSYGGYVGYKPISGSLFYNADGTYHSAITQDLGALYLAAKQCRENGFY